MGNAKNQFAWDLMLFELAGNKLNEFGACTVVEKNIQDGGGVVSESRQFLKLTQRLYTPTAGERFDAI